MCHHAQLRFLGICADGESFSIPGTHLDDQHMTGAQCPPAPNSPPGNNTAQGQKGF